MPEKYFATSMKRIPIGENEYIYIVDSVIAGNIDETTKIFTSTTGQTYKRINDFSGTDSNINYYSNAIETESLTNFLDRNISYLCALDEYEKNCRQVIYYIEKKQDDEYVLSEIDKRKHQKGILKNGVLKLSQEEQDKILDSEEEDAFIEEIKKLVCDIALGKFSPDELIDIKCRLIDQKEELDSAIEAVSLQQDALDEDLECRIEVEQQASILTPTPLQKKTQYSEENGIDINDVFLKITRTLIAQDEPARRTIVEIARIDDMSEKEHGILLTGGTGVGKSLLMRLISKYLNRPVLIIDSTQLTAPAYIGRSIEQYLWELYESCGKDLKLAEKAIVYFDEIDKKGSEKKSDANGQAVLNTLLKFVEGTDYIACQNPQHVNPNNSVKIRTNDMIVTGGGAFLEVYKKTKQKQQIGFGDQEQQPSCEQIEPDINDFIAKAMMTNEFMGRFPIIIHLNDLNFDSIRRIMLESDKSALKQQQAVFKKRGVKLSTQDGYIIAVANKALDRKLGARGLNKIVADSTWKAYDDVRSNPGKYEEIILTEQTVSDPKIYQYIKKTNN